MFGAWRTGYSQPKERPGEWRLALALLHDLQDKQHRCSIITYSACMSVCEKAQQWQHAMALLRELRSDIPRLRRNVIAYNAAITACLRVGRVDSGNYYKHL
eukprot:s285_g23.t1